MQDASSSSRKSGTFENAPVRGTGAQARVHKEQGHSADAASVTTKLSNSDLRATALARLTEPVSIAASDHQVQSAAPKLPSKSDGANPTVAVERVKAAKGNEVAAHPQAVGSKSAQTASPSTATVERMNTSTSSASVSAALSTQTPAIPRAVPSSTSGVNVSAGNAVTTPSTRSTYTLPDAFSNTPGTTRSAQTSNSATMPATPTKAVAPLPERAAAQPLSLIHI